MTLKFIYIWIFSQNADIHDYMNLKLVAPFNIRHINTNNINLEQSKPNILVKFLHKGKHTHLPRS